MPSSSACFLDHWREWIDAKLELVKYQRRFEVYIFDLPFMNFLLAYFLKKASCVTGRAR